MDEDQSMTDDELSLLALATLLLRRRAMVVRWMVAGVMIAASTVIWQVPVFKASASFMPQGNDAGRSSLTGIAGQFGVQLPTANPLSAPELYTRVLNSEVLLQSIAGDTFVVAEHDGKREAFVGLFEIGGDSRSRQLELGVTKLRAIVETSVAKGNALVQLSVVTPWRSVSLAIAQKLLSGVDTYNNRTRQGQAISERRFIEGRMLSAASELRVAEDHLQDLLTKNKQISGSPELSFERDRLQRVIMLKQQVYTSLVQSYEDARLREVRDTPVITIIEPPWAPSVAEPRGRLKRAFLGLLLGTFFGSMFALISSTLSYRRAETDIRTAAFLSVLQEIRSDCLGQVQRIVPWARGRRADRKHDL